MKICVKFEVCNFNHSEAIVY